MAVTIKNTKQIDAENKLVCETNEKLILEYLQKTYPWITLIDGYFCRKKWWGDYYGLICFIDHYSGHNMVRVRVRTDFLGSAEFGNLLESIYPNHDIEIEILEYQEKYQISHYGHF